MSDTAPSRPTYRTSTPHSELERAAWPALSDDLLAVLRRHGQTRDVARGELLFDVGEDSYDLFYIESGAVDILDRTGDRTVVRIEAGHFLGELGMLMGQKTFLASVAATETRVIVVTQSRLRELVATVPEVGDVIVTAFAARRRLLVEWREGALILVGRDGDPGALRLREFASRSLIPYRWVDRADEAAIAQVAQLCDLPPTGTVAVVGRAQVLRGPSPRELAQAMGLDLVADTDETFDVLVVGAGPAGLAASVYAASEGLSVLVIEDTAIGGQAGTSSRIENYLGFPRGVSGAELAYRGEVQAIKFGARITAPRRATSLEFSDGLFSIGLDDERRVRGRTVILASGVQYRRLPLPHLEKLEGRGVYYAATDLEARFIRDQEVAIVGGGNSAGQAAMFLSRYARRVHVVVRGEGLSATMSSYLSQRIESDARIHLWTRSEVCRLGGDDALDSVTLCHRETGRETRLDVGALFIMAGAAPNTGWLNGRVELDSKGFILTGRDAGAGGEGYATSLPGVYAVGDIRAGSVKRVASAVGEGSVVVSAVHGHLETLRGDTPPVVTA